MKRLPNYAQALSQDPAEDLSWQSPFEIYSGREEWDVPLDKYTDTTTPYNPRQKCWEGLFTLPLPLIQC